MTNGLDFLAHWAPWPGHILVSSFGFRNFPCRAPLAITSARFLDGHLFVLPLESKSTVEARAMTMRISISTSPSAFRPIRMVVASLSSPLHSPESRKLGFQFLAPRWRIRPRRNLIPVAPMRLAVRIPCRDSVLVSHHRWIFWVVPASRRVFRDFCNAAVSPHVFFLKTAFPT